MAMTGIHREPFTITVDGQELHVAVRPGNNTETPLLICNGIGANLELLDSFVDALAGLEVIRFDAPGTGASPAPALPYRFRGLAHLVAGMLDTLGYEQVDVMGISWGGALAQQFAHSHPERCRRLVLAATSAGVVMVPGRPSVLAKMISPRRYSDREAMQAMAPELYGGEFRTDPDLVRRFWQHVQAHEAQIGYFWQLFAASGWTSIFWLHRLKQPTLVLVGEDDPIVPPINGRLLAKRIPNARLESLPCGHLFVFTYTHQTAALVQEFLATRDTRSDTSRERDRNDDFTGS